MKIVSSLAVAAALTIGAVSAAPALGQGNAAAQPAAEQRKFNFTKGAQKALSDLQKAANAGDAATYPAALAAAQAAAKNSDDRYFIAQMQLSFASKTNDDAGKRAAVDAIIASGGAQPSELPRLYRAQGDFAMNAKDNAKAAAAYSQLLQLEPNNTDVLNNLVLLHREQKNYPAAMELIRKNIDTAKAAGQPVPEKVYRLGLQTALDGNMNQQILPLTREFLAAYPNQQNWAVALDLYRQSSKADDATLVDTFRLMRSAKALDQANEYLALADALAQGRYYAEARDVVNEGIAAGKYNASNASAAAILKEVSPKIAEDKAALSGLEARARSGANGDLALRVAEGYYGHGDYRKAAEFYRTALQKGGVDANLVNTRMGMALAQAGQKAEAEAALKAVTGARADLAGFWLLWLNSRA